MTNPDPTERALTAAQWQSAKGALLDAIEGQNLYHGRYGTTPAGTAAAMAILSGLRDRGFSIVVDAERAARAPEGARPPDVDALCEELRQAGERFAATGGTGDADAAKTELCPDCTGTGYVRHSGDFHFHAAPSETGDREGTTT